jgi:hypothetical protein
MATKTCTTCLIEKEISNFKVEKRPRYRGDYENTCKDCKNKTNARYRNTYQGYLKGLLKKARSNSKVRTATGREEAGKFDLTYEELVDILENQNHKCYYSNVSLVFNTKSNYQASIERLNTNKGYEKSNVVVCCLEFNDKQQWSKEKVKEMYNILQSPHDCSTIDFSLKRKRNSRNLVIRKEFDKNHFHQCRKCMEVKPLNQFYKNKRCKDCVRLNDQERLKDPRSALLMLLKLARSNSTNRQKRSTAENRDFTFDLTFNELVEIYQSQKGLCAYSGLPLRFGNSKDINWKISLERLDTKKGYTKNNVCLIAYEFNVGDKRVLYNDDSTGSCGWSKEKFQYIFDHIKKFYQP